MYTDCPECGEPAGITQGDTICSNPGCSRSWKPKPYVSVTCPKCGDSLAVSGREEGRRYGLEWLLKHGETCKEFR